MEDHGGRLTLEKARWPGSEVSLILPALLRRRHRKDVKGVACRMTS